MDSVSDPAVIDARAFVGTAYGYDGSHAAPSGTRIYARINRAF